MRKVILILISLFLPFFSFAQIIYVNQAANGQNDGTSWQNAYNYLQDALNVVSTNDTIWVADGIYIPTTNDPTIKFEIPSGIALYGGFEGDEISLEERNLDNGETVLSGNIGDINDGYDNSYTISALEYVGGTTTIIDGFTMRYAFVPSAMWGNCDDPFICHGGGLHISGMNSPEFAVVKIQNCKFIANYVVKGGGIYLDAKNGLIDLKIENCVFLSNTIFLKTGEAQGAGIYIEHIGDSLQMEQFLIQDCIFEFNSSAYEGSGIFFTEIPASMTVSPSFTVNNCLFEGNHMSGYGGGGSAITMYMDSDIQVQDVKITNSIFHDNEAGNANILGFGGAIIGFCDMTIENCTFSENSSFEGGAIFYQGTLTSINNYFLNNRSNSVGGAISAQGSIYYLNTVFARNHANYQGGAIYNETLGTRHTNSVFYGNIAGNAGGATYIEEFYPENTGVNFIQNSIFWNNKALTTNAHNISNGGDTLSISNSIFDISICDSIALGNPNLVQICENTHFNTYPNFTDTLNNDFSLTCNSIGIDNGTAVPDLFADILTDIAGNPRILGSQIDIGAYEYNGFSLDTLLQDATSETSADGSIFLENIMGGTPPFTFLWNTGDTMSSLENILAGEYEVTITDQQDCSKSFVFTIGFPNALEAVGTTKEGIIVYPNPTNSSLKVTFSSPTKRAGNIQIFAANGKQIGVPFPFTAAINSTDLSLVHLSSGVYFLRIEMEGQVFFEKMIKQ